MRCPKCKFFSFDDLATCAKCFKDLSAVIEELHGTCTEATPPFFLSSVIESPELEEQAPSESQELPPTTDDTDISFDETLTGGGVSLSMDEDDTVLAGLDESIEFSDDEISLEVGDIMPIDLDQFDEPSDLESDLDLDETIGLSSLAGDDDVDLNFGDELSDQDDLDSTEILSADALDGDIDLDLTGNFDVGGDVDLSEDFDSFDLDETSISLGSDSEETEALELDDSLLAELQGGSEEDDLLSNELPAELGDDLEDFNLDETSISLEPIDTPKSFDANETLNIADLPPGEFEFESEDEELAFDDTLSGELTLGDSTLEGLDFDLEDEEQPADELLATTDTDLDQGLVELEPEQPEAELDLAESTLDGLVFDTEDEEQTSAETPLEELSFDTEDEEQLGDELLATMDEELDLDMVELDPDHQDEELALDDAPLEELEPSKSPSLGLDEIDVSDLLSSAEDESHASLEGEEVDLTTLMEDDTGSHESDLELLDDDMPEIELIEEDEGSFDLP